MAYFWLNNTNCSISLNATVAVSDSQRSSQALYYSLMITLVCLCHIYATVQMIKNISQNEHDGGRYSLITLSFFTIWDVFMCLFHLYNALTTQVCYFLEIKCDFVRTFSIISLHQHFGTLSLLQYLRPDYYLLYGKLDTIKASR